MSFLLQIKPKTRLVLGIVFSVLALVMFYIVWTKDTGFIGGLMAGLLTGAGIGVVATYKKTNFN
jgi:hypothetical protein